MNNDEVKTTGIENPSNDEGFENIFVSIRKNKNDAVHRVELALNDAEKQDLPIINPMLDNEEIIDREWERYNSYTKPFRRKSDWIALQYFGMDNMQIYDHLKSDMYGKEYVKVGKITDGNCGSSDDPLNLAESADELYYVPVSQRVDDIDQALSTIDNLDNKMEEAEQYMRDQGYVLLIPALIPNLDILENYWDAYKTMVMRHQRMSDWKTMELFGLTNEQIYIAMKKKFLERGADYKNDENDPNVELYVTENRLLESYFDTGIQKDDFTVIEQLLHKISVAVFSQQHNAHFVILLEYFQQCVIEGLRTVYAVGVVVGKYLLQLHVHFLFDLLQQFVDVLIMRIKRASVDSRFGTQFPYRNFLYGLYRKQLQKRCLEHLLRKHHSVIFS